MFQLSNVSVGLFFQDPFVTPVRVDSNGCVGTPIQPGDRLQAIAQVQPNASHLHVFVITVDGQWRRPTAVQDLAKELKLEPGRAYARGFDVTANDNGLRIDHHRSSLRILDLAPDGKFVLAEAGAFVQNGKIFFATVVAFEGQCYRDESGHVRAPVIDDWNSMWAYMEELLGEEAVRNLPPLSTYVSPPAPSDLPPGRARIVRFSPWNNYGFAETAQGQCRIHPKRSLAECQPLLPQPGQIIGYESVVGGDKPELDKWYFVES